MTANPISNIPPIGPMSGGQGPSGPTGPFKPVDPLRQQSNLHGRGTCVALFRLVLLD